MKTYTNELGHVANMAAMPIYGKKLSKSSPEPLVQLPWKLVFIDRYFQVCLYDDLGLTLIILRQGQTWENANTQDLWNVLKIFALKIGKNSCLGGGLKVYEYKRTRSFFDLWVRTLIVWQFQTSPQKATEPIVTKFHIEPPCLEEKKICSNRPGYMTNLTTTPIYGKNLQISSFPEPMDW